MHPKEKAQELINKFKEADYTDIGTAGTKQCATIVVDEIISFIPYGKIKETIAPYDNCELHTEYWEEVKKEIENI